MIRIAFTEDMRLNIIKSQKALGMFLIEEQIHADGNWLLFDTSPRPEPVDEFALLKAKITALEVKVASLEKA